MYCSISALPSSKWPFLCGGRLYQDAPRRIYVANPQVLVWDPKARSSGAVPTPRPTEKKTKASYQCLNENPC